VVERIFMTGFLVVLARGSYEQLVICLLASVAMLKTLSSRRPYMQMVGVPDNNNTAEAMLEQTIGTLVLCVLLKTGKEGGYGMLGDGTLDLLVVACQFWLVRGGFNMQESEARKGRGGAGAQVRG